METSIKITLNLNRQKTLKEVKGVCIKHQQLHLMTETGQQISKIKKPELTQAFLLRKMQAAAAACFGPLHGLGREQRS